MLVSLPHSPGLQDALTVIALLLIPTLLLLSGCRKKRRHKPADNPRPMATKTLGGTSAAQCSGLDGLLLPAGLYFRHHTYDTCSDKRSCAPAKAAVLVGIARTAAGAERRAAQAGRTLPALPTGYPLVVHTDELGLADGTLEGVAVVAGLFRNLRAAHRWHTACGALHPAARVLPLANSPAAFSRLPADMPRRHYVVRIDQGLPTPAYAEQDLEQLHPSAPPAKVAPLCSLSPGRLFVFNTRHIRWYKWAPVRCGNRKAYVRWTRSLLATSVLRRPGGVTLLRQVTGVDCEHPQLTTWRYGPRGRRPLAPARPVTARQR